MRSGVAVLAGAGLAVAALAACRDGPVTAADSRLVIGTGGEGGIYHPLGRALAERLTAHDAERSYTIVTTGGSLENIERVLAGELALGFAIGTSVYEAYAGGLGFDAPREALRVVSPLHANLTHVLVAEDSGIDSVAALRGRVVSIGSEGSGTEQVARHLLEEHGLSFADVQARHLDFRTSIDALLAGELDAAVLSVGAPAPVVTRALQSGRARLVEVDAERVRTMADRYPYYSEGEIPADTYDDQPQAVTTLVVLNWIVARDDLPATVARAVLDILNTERDLLRNAVALHGEINLRNLFAAPVPLHAAARAWLGEAPPTPAAGEQPDTAAGARRP